MRISKKLAVVFITGALILMGCTTNQPTTDSYEKSVTQYVEPFWGSNQGNILPGVSVPFGMVKLSPNVLPPNTTNGYNADKPIVGFSHNHTSGTGGGPRYGNIQVIPNAGEIDINDYVSLKKTNEHATPGYYTVTLARKPGDVRCELTASKKVGFHRYQFYNWKKEDSIQANILINVSHTISRNPETQTRCTNAKTSIISATEIVGEGSFMGGWGGDNPYTVYFYAQFDTPFSTSGTWSDKKLQPQTQSAEGKNIGAYASFNLQQKDIVQMKVAISYISIEQAKKNMSEINHWDFVQATKDNEQEWNNYLTKIQVEGGSLEERKMFYSALRNTMLMPTDVTGENPNWKSDKPHFWDHYCLWDVFRTCMPLHTLIYPEKQTAIINSLLDIYDHRGWLPDAWIAGDYASIQGGTNADVVIADAVVKGLKGFDEDKAYEAIRKNGTVTSDKPNNYGRYLNDYLKYGYVTRYTTNGASSATIEYAYNDFCIAQVAKKLGKDDDYNTFKKRAMGVFTLFHDSAKYFWAKDTVGAWEPNFSIHSTLSDHWNDPYFYEGGSETYSYYVPHAMQELINRHGGAVAFMKNLDSFFDEDRFQLGNEPLFLVPYSYNYAARPDKTALRVRKILATQYTSGERGLPGQDDSGAMSSWYIFSSLGFFPVAGQDVYLIGSPVFSRARLNLANGKYLEMLAKDASHKNIYVQSVKINGKSWSKSWFSHQDIINGAVIEFVMGDKPSSWGQGKESLPPSLTK